MNRTLELQDRANKFKQMTKDNEECIKQVETLTGIPYSQDNQIEIKDILFEKFEDWVKNEKLFNTQEERLWGFIHSLDIETQIKFFTQFLK